MAEALRYLRAKANDEGVVGCTRGGRAPRFVL